VNVHAGGTVVQKREVVYLTNTFSAGIFMSEVQTESQALAHLSARLPQCLKFSRAFVGYHLETRTSGLPPEATAK